MKSAIDCFEMNRIGWDRRAEVHFRSKFYDVEGFLNGATSLRELELRELKSVAGRRLLHLQCHFGLDTLSWARLGANCTGVDISPVAIEQAKQLSRRSDLEAKFVCSNVYDFNLGAVDPYAIVFTSYGTVCWLPDLKRWADVVSSNLAEGGTFYMVEFHPIYDFLSGYSYFTADGPEISEEGTYTENGNAAVARFATWAHPLSSVVNALIESGIQIVHLNEFPYSPYNCFEGMEEREPGRAGSISTIGGMMSQLSTAFMAGKPPDNAIDTWGVSGRVSFGSDCLEQFAPFRFLSAMHSGRMNEVALGPRSIPAWLVPVNTIDDPGQGLDRCGIDGVFLAPG